MNSSYQRHDAVAEEQAALWAARLDGDTLDGAQRAELDAWLARNPAHRTLLSQYCQFSADLEEQVPALVTAGAIEMPATRSAARRRWSFPRLAGLTLAAAAVAVTIAVVRPSSPVENVATSPGQRGTHTLADGTRVELNAHTSLRFENSKTERRVRLASGEALFIVTKDAARPFVVETPTGLVRVTGTTFNVRTDSSASAFEVTVVEGSVQVRPNESGGASAAPVSLTANDRLVTQAGVSAIEALNASALDDALAWRQGQIVFRDVPLAEALARFAHHHGRRITATPDLAGKPIGGRYSIDDVNGFLAGLELALPELKAVPDPSGAWSVTRRPGR